MEKMYYFKILIQTKKMPKIFGIKTQDFLGERQVLLCLRLKNSF